MQDLVQESQVRKIPSFLSFCGDNLGIITLERGFGGEERGTFCSFIQGSNVDADAGYSGRDRDVVNNIQTNLSVYFTHRLLQ